MGRLYRPLGRFGARMPAIQGSRQKYVSTATDAIFLFDGSSVTEQSTTRAH